MAIMLNYLPLRGMLSQKGWLRTEFVLWEQRRRGHKRIRGPCDDDSLVYYKHVQ